jgi:hypothetical protein
MMMTAAIKRRMKFAIGLALCACLVSWLIVGETSPLSVYFLEHVELPNLWMTLHTLPYLVLVIFRPMLLGDVVLYALVFLQWFLIGYLLALLIFRT